MESQGERQIGPRTWLVALFLVAATVLSLATQMLTAPAAQAEIYGRISPYNPAVVDIWAEYDAVGLQRNRVNRIIVSDCGDNVSVSICFFDGAGGVHLGNDASTSGPPAGCAPRGFVGPDPMDGLLCHATSFYINLGGGNDQIEFRGSFPPAYFNIEGGQGDDVMQGSPNSDRIHGQEGLDTIHGEGGNDRIFGGLGDDFELFGGPGVDCIKGEAGNDLVDGGTGDDFCENDTMPGLDGGPGTDTVAGGGGNDLLAGGSDNDTIYGDRGRDPVPAGGRDQVLYLGPAYNAGVNVSIGLGERDDGLDGERDTVAGDIEGVNSGDGDDVLSGNGSSQRFYGGGGDDTVSYADRDEAVKVTVGDGQFGFHLPGNDGANNGAEGDDVTSTIDNVIGGSGNDDLSCPNCNQSITLLGGPGQDRLRGGPHSDTLDGEEDTDYLYGNEGADNLFGGAGNFLDYVEGGPGEDVIEGEGGDDALFGQGDTDTIYGGPGEDTIDGGANDDFVYGGTDGDPLFGGEGNDEIYGEGGPDILNGGSGADLLDGGETGGRDCNNGGPFLQEDCDLVDYYEAVDVGLTLDDNQYNDGQGCGPLPLPCEADNVINVEVPGLPESSPSSVVGSAKGTIFIGGNQGDYFIGRSAKDVMFGRGGNDILVPGGGPDFVDGGEGDDSIDLRDDPPIADTAFGGLGNDTLLGIDYLDSVVDGVEIGKTYAEMRGNKLYVLAGPNRADDFTVSAAAGKIRVANPPGQPMQVAPGSPCSVASGNAVECTTQPANVTIQALDQNDQVKQDLTTGRTVPSSISLTAYGGTGNDVLKGHEGLDWFEGGQGDDDLYGATRSGTPEDGMDVMVGGEGSDDLYGGRGADLLLSGEKTANGATVDRYFGEQDDDTITGGPGRDEITGGLGKDTMSGADGSDLLKADDSVESSLHLKIRDNLIDCGPGQDSYTADSEDTKSPSPVVGCESATGNPQGQASASLVQVQSGQLRVEGRPSVLNKVTVSYSSFTGKYTVRDLSVDLGESGCARDADNQVSCSGVSSVYVDTGDLKDQVKLVSMPSSAPTEIRTGDGADKVTGSAGPDSIYGGGGKDKLSGGDGDDLIEGGPGGDVMSGRNGSDTVSYADKTTAVDVFLAHPATKGNGETTATVKDYPGFGKGTLENDKIKLFENVIGGSGNDIMQGNPLANKMYGGYGADHYSSGAGDDTLQDALPGSGAESGADTYWPGLGKDTVKAGSGADSIDTRDGERDTSIDCGSGVDTGQADNGPSVFDPLTFCEF